MSFQKAGACLASSHAQAGAGSIVAHLRSGGSLLNTGAMLYEPVLPEFLLKLNSSHPQPQAKLWCTSYECQLETQVPHF